MFMNNFFAFLFDTKHCFDTIYHANTMLEAAFGYAAKAKNKEK